MTREWTSDELRLLHKQYYDKSHEYLESKLNRTWEGIRKKAERLDLKRKIRRPRKPSKRMGQFYDNDKTYVGLYKKGLSITEVAKVAQVHTKTLRKRFKKLGVPIRNLEYSSGYRKYPLDEHFFDIIDTEEKAYFLGFMFADGFVSVKHNNFLVGVEIHKRDIEILKKFKKALKSKSPLYFNHFRNSVRLRVYSKTLVRQLILKGCVPNKSLVLKFPCKSLMSKRLLHHFMRGYFDGDGSFRIHQEKQHPSRRLQVNFSIYSSEKFCIEYQNKLCSMITINKTKLYKRDGISEMVYCGKNNIKKIYNFLYEGANLFLFRKKKRFEKYLNN